MRKNRFSFAAIAALTVTLSLCGCADADLEGNAPPKSGSIAEQTADMLSNITDGTISGTADGGASAAIINGSITANIVETDAFPTMAKVCKRKSKTFTAEQLLDLYDGEPHKSEMYTDENKIYETDDGQYGFVYDSGISYETDSGGFLEIVHNRLDVWEKYEFFSDDEDLDFAPREEVLKNVRQELQNRFGIAPEEWEPGEFVTVKKEGGEYYKNLVIREVENAEKQPGFDENDLGYQKDKVAAERAEKHSAKDFYYIRLKFNIDGIPVFDDDVFSDRIEVGELLPCPYAELIYTDKGIESIYLGSLTENDTSGVPEEYELIGVDKARELILKKYNETFFDGEIEVQDVQLAYLSVPQNDLNELYTNFESRPFYVFTCKKTEVYEGETYSYEFPDYFDAVTGKDLGVRP